MAKQTINLGTSLNAGDGDPLRTAFDKINDNFDELYARDLGTDPENIGTNLAPSVNGASDLGTTPQRWGTVFVRDFIDIGNGSTITVNADGEFVFNKPIISTVAVKNDIVGSIFADDSSIAFNAQTNTFFGQFDGDVTGSVYADNSTVLVDGVNGTISAANLTGALPAIDGSALTGVSASSVAFSNVTSTPTTLSGYGITDAATLAAPAFTGAVDFTGTTSVDFTGATVTGLTVTGDVTGSVFADDSTLLIDSVNGTLNSSALTKPIALADNEKITFGNDDDLEIFHNSSNGNTIIENNTGNLVIKGSNLFLQSASSEYFFRGAANGAVTIYHDNVAKFETTTDGISVTDHIALPDSGELRLGTDNDMQILHSGANGFVKSTTGTLVLQGSTVRIQDAGSSQTAISAADGIATLLFENTAVLNTTAGGIQIEQGVEEKFATLTGSTGVVAHDCDNGHVFYHTGAAGDITANFTNLGSTQEYATNLTVIINQGATPYEVTAVQIGGAAQTINWQGGSAPTGNANGIDSFSFTILNDGGTYVVLGQMVDFT